MCEQPSVIPSSLSLNVLVCRPMRGPRRRSAHISMDTLLICRAGGTWHLDTLLSGWHLPGWSPVAFLPGQPEGLSCSEAAAYLGKKTWHWQELPSLLHNIKNTPAPRQPPTYLKHQLQNGSGGKHQVPSSHFTRLSPQTKISVFRTRSIPFLYSSSLNPLLTVSPPLSINATRLLLF